MTSLQSWTTRITIAIGILGITGSAAAEPFGAPTLTLRVVNQAGISHDVLSRAQAVTARIYESAGIHLDWRNTAGPDPRRFFYVNVVTAAPGHGDFTTRGLLGIAPGARDGLGLHVWTFYEIVQAVATRIGLDSGVLLGHVMAHEVGHLLLAGRRHSHKGLMRNGWDGMQANLALKGTLTFSAEESSLIRRRLSR
jgi:hypothetical protein